MKLRNLLPAAVSVLWLSMGSANAVPGSIVLSAETTFAKAIGWSTGTNGIGIPGGQSTSGFEVGRDKTVFHTGHASGTIRCTSKDGDGWRSITQGIRADKYRGKRVRFQGYVKTKDVSSFAGLWMRVDAMDRTVAFDNMSDRPLNGTKDWTLCSVVLDVPNDAVGIFYGLVMAGAGQSWMDDLTLETVYPSAVQTTADSTGPDTEKDPLELQNADFTQRPTRTTERDVPGWTNTSEKWDGAVKLDTQIAHDGKPAVHMHCTQAGFDSLCLWQEIKADHYRGKRVLFQTYVKSSGNVPGGATVAIPGGGQWVVAPVPQYTDKDHQWVKDTREWKPVSAVVDIPNWATCIQLGFQLNGPAEVWVSSASVKVVDPKTNQVTQAPAKNEVLTASDVKSLPLGPVNLDFEH